MTRNGNRREFGGEITIENKCTVLHEDESFDFMKECGNDDTS